MEGTGGVPVNEDPQIISDSVSAVVSFVQSYGWVLVGVACAALYLRSRMSSQISQWSQSREDAREKKVDGAHALRRHEAMQFARARMQEKLDEQSKDFMEKQKEKEEAKRQEKIAQWDADTSGKSRPKKLISSPPSTSGASEPSSGRPKKTKLRPEYNPLMGDTWGGSCSFRPSRNRGGMGGG